MKTRYLKMCGAHNPQPNFWQVRNCFATLAGLKDEHGKTVAFQTAIVHIMKCLDDMEAAMLNVRRCNKCGVMMNSGQALFVFGEAFCMDCGTALVESESLDGALRPGLAADLAKQANSDFTRSGLAKSYQAESPNNSYWRRICLACPEVGQLWLAQRKAA